LLAREKEIQAARALADAALQEAEDKFTSPANDDEEDCT
jgi:hypothetical protein